MKLLDWIRPHIYRSPEDFTEDSKGLHVIGTCGKCNWFSGPGLTGSVPCCNHESELVDICGPNDGCINFEPKEGS